MKNTILKLFLLFCAVPSIGQNVHPNLPWIDISGQRERQDNSSGQAGFI